MGARFDAGAVRFAFSAPSGFDAGAAGVAFAPPFDFAAGAAGLAFAAPFGFAAGAAGFAFAAGPGFASGIAARTDADAEGRFCPRRQASNFANGSVFSTSFASSPARRAWNTP